MNIENYIRSSAQDVLSTFDYLDFESRCKRAHNHIVSLVEMLYHEGKLFRYAVARFRDSESCDFAVHVQYETDTDFITINIKELNNALYS